MGVWPGCGHAVVPKFFKNDILSVVGIVDFMDDNPKELCYDCWAKARGLPYDWKRLGEKEPMECPKCGGKRYGYKLSDPTMLECYDCGHEGKGETMKTLDISGFGGDYEKACQTMLTQGLRWLAKNYEPNKLKYGSYENVYGLLIAENDFSKEFDKAVCANVEPSGAMHQAVTQTVMFIVKNGYDDWLKKGDPKDQYFLYDPKREKALKKLADLKLLDKKVDENPRHERCPQCKHGEDPPPHENCHDCFLTHKGVAQTYVNFVEKD